MITTTSTSEFRSCEEDKADIVVVRYEPSERTQNGSMLFIRRVVKWFGFLSTIAWGAAALAPDTFNVPLNFRPWVFLTFIFWFVAFCAGSFNL